VVAADDVRLERIISDPSDSPSPRLRGRGGRGVRGYTNTNTLTLPILLALILVPIDLMLASAGFNPASDPALLDFTPPAIQWLTQQPGDWRYTSLDTPGRPDVMKANMGMRYGLDDIRGYE